MNWITTLRRRIRVKRRRLSIPNFIATDKPASIGLYIDSEENDADVSEEIKTKLAQAISSFGELPVLVLSHKSASVPLNIEIVRFAHRLDCPPHLFGNGSLLTEAQAEAFILAGLVSYTAIIAGLNESAHQSITGTVLKDCMESVNRLRNTAIELQRPLRLKARIPWQGLGAENSIQTYEWLKTMRFDEISLIPPMSPSVPANAPKQLEYFINNKDEIHKTSENLIRFLSDEKYRAKHTFNRHLHPIHMNRNLFPFLTDSILG